MQFTWKKRVNRESNSFTGLNWPWGFREVEAPRFQDSQHMNLVRLWAVHTGNTKSNSTGKKVWQAFDNVCRNFLGNEKAENYNESVYELISSHSAVECNMSLKLHCTHSHFISSKHGNRLRWSWRKVTSGYFPDWEKVHCKMESKYVFSEFFSSQDTEYRDAVHYLVLDILIRNQSITLLLHI
jgi:hypothetical protein